MSAEMATDKRIAPEPCFAPIFDGRILAHMNDAQVTSNTSGTGLSRTR